MADIVKQTFFGWTKCGDALKSRINIYYKIRDFPYAIIPTLNDTKRYVEILRCGRGSCMPKHFLLCNMYQRLGLLVLFAVYPFRWDEAQIDYPPKIRNLAKKLPTSYHICCQIDVDGQFILVDATLDPALEKLGLPINKNWDGVSNTVLPLAPCGEKELYYPAEVHLTKENYNDTSLSFFNELNRWLDTIRLARTRG